MAGVLFVIQGSLTFWELANMKKPETKVITNFSGRLTRILNGDLNSGFAKFTSSFGYDPFSKPLNLTWLERPADVSGVNDLVLDGKVRFIGETSPSAYLIGSTGKLWKIQINSTTDNSVHSVVGIHSVLASSATYLKGASMEFFGSNEKIYIGADSQINSINFDGTADTLVGNKNNYAVNVFRPMTEFIGKLVFGNGPTIAAISATGTVTSSVIGVSSAVGNVYSELNPPLPSASRVKDLDTSPDNNYVLVSASDVDYENVSSGSTPNMLNTVPADSKIYYWNGTDAATTAGTTLSTNLLTALQSYLQQNHIFASDSLGTGLYAENRKVLTLPNNKSPFPNATGVNGQFLFWSAPERVVVDGNARLMQTMYYYGALDQENPPGLWRILRQTPSVGLQGNTVEMPFNKVVSINYSDANAAQSSVITAGIGTHYYSVREVSNDAVVGSVLGLRRLTIPATGSGTPQLGVYETQTELFSKRISVSQIRVYTEPTVANNGFKIELIGSDGEVISNGTFTYNFAAGSDVTQLQGALERINFNPSIKTTFALGVRITNTGSANMTIKKVELDLSEEGK